MEDLSMLFSKKESEIKLPEDARCSKCRKRIKKHENYMVLDGKIYCEKCARRKRDADMITFALMMDDD